jgi:hypothetical protein
VIAGMLVKGEVDAVFPEKIIIGAPRTRIVHAEEI